MEFNILILCFYSFSSPPQSSRFVRPDFEQFRPTDFNSEATYKNDQDLQRPIRHTSYPSSTYSENSEDNFNYNPDSGSDSGFKEYIPPSFGDNTNFKNFFIDHNSNGFSRPSRSSSSPNFVEPSYEVKSPNSPTFDPSYDALISPPSRPINSRHG